MNVRTKADNRFDPYVAQTRIDNGTNNGAWNDNPYTYQSGTQDRATGTIKFGQRWYNPTTGTWTQQDNLNKPLDPQNANRYQYPADNPTNLNDPTGRCSIFDDVGLDCIASTVEAAAAPVITAAASVAVITVGVAACSTPVGCFAGAPLIASGGLGLYGSYEFASADY